MMNLAIVLVCALSIVCIFLAVQGIRRTNELLRQAEDVRNKQKDLERELGQHQPWRDEV